MPARTVIATVASLAMAWRQGQSYSEDLRGRVMAAVDGGMAARAAASVFRVSVSYIYKALIRRRRTGEVSACARLRRNGCAALGLWVRRASVNPLTKGVPGKAKNFGSPAVELAATG